MRESGVTSAHRSSKRWGPECCKPLERKASQGRAGTQCPAWGDGGELDRGGALEQGRARDRQGQSLEQGRARDRGRPRQKLSTTHSVQPGLCRAGLSRSPGSRVRDRTSSAGPSTQGTAVWHFPARMHTCLPCTLQGGFQTRRPCAIPSPTPGVPVRRPELRCPSVLPVTELLLHKSTSLACETFRLPPAKCLRFKHALPVLRLECLA